MGLRLSFTVKWHAFDPVPASFSLAISPLAVSGRIASIHHVMSPATGTLYLRLVGIQRVEPEASHCSQIDGKNRTDRCATPKHAVLSCVCGRPGVVNGAWLFHRNVAPRCRTIDLSILSMVALSILLIGELWLERTRPLHADMPVFITAICVLSLSFN